MMGLLKIITDALLVFVQPLAFLTVRVNGIEVPETPPIKLTVITPLGKAASVTPEIPVPEME